MTFAIILAIIGGILIVGPTILKFFLVSAASIVPVSEGTIVYLIIMLCINIISTIALKIVFLKKRNVARKRKVNKLVIITHNITIFSILLIILNGLINKASENWIRIMTEKANIFSMMMHVGIIMVMLAIGFFIGRNYRKEDSSKKVNKSAEVENQVSNYTITSFVMDQDLDVELPAKASETLM